MTSTFSITTKEADMQTSKKIPLAALAICIALAPVAGYAAEPRAHAATETAADPSFALARPAAVDPTELTDQEMDAITAGQAELLGGLRAQIIAVVSFFLSPESEFIEAQAADPFSFTRRANPFGGGNN